MDARLENFVAGLGFKISLHVFFFSFERTVDFISRSPQETDNESSYSLMNSHRDLISDLWSHFT